MRRSSTVSNEVTRLWHILFNLENTYDHYASDRKLSRSLMYVLFRLSSSTEPMTQKQLCNEMLLSKQTINSLVRILQREGYLELQGLPEDQRQKRLVLTEAGRQRAEQVVPPLLEAETAAMSQFTPEERRTLFDLLERYIRGFCHKL